MSAWWGEVEEGGRVHGACVSVGVHAHTDSLIPQEV